MNIIQRLLFKHNKKYREKYKRKLAEKIIKKTILKELDSRVIVGRGFIDFSKDNKIKVILGIIIYYLHKILNKD